MSRKEFENRLEEFQEKVGMLKIVVGYEAFADFTIGCFFDFETGKWKVYRNEERGIHIIRLETEDEEEAFEALFSMVNFNIKLQERLKKRNLRKK